jgi:hypothetical protein
MSERRAAALEQLRKALQSHPYTPEQIADTLIHALYSQLSSGARDTYHQLGRGAALVDLRNLEGGELDTTYMPQAMLLRLNAESGLFADAEEALNDYDPEREFVVIVWQATLILVYRLQLL